MKRTYYKLVIPGGSFSDITSVEVNQTTGFRKLIETPEEIELAIRDFAGENNSNLTDENRAYWRKLAGTIEVYKVVEESTDVEFNNPYNV